MKIRPANSSDINWICNLLVEGANSGHFLPSVANQAKTLSTSIINDGYIRMLKLRYGSQTPTVIKATAKVAEIDDSPASFLITLTDNQEIELHLSATRKQFRKRGCMKALVQDELNTYATSGKRIYSRCYPKSTWAISTFKKLGFEISNRGNPIELDYKSSNTNTHTTTTIQSLSHSEQITTSRLKRFMSWLKRN
ncbi:MAG: N-acetyltransferase [Rhodocyclaceae bacterium]|nr:MAG: N-acetyltransferase [Rhodocyclaceae bacterium]